MPYKNSLLNAFPENNNHTTTRVLQPIISANSTREHLNRRSAPATTSMPAATRKMKKAGHISGDLPFCLIHAVCKSRK
jgi:hypothetical protein